MDLLSLNGPEKETQPQSLEEHLELALQKIQGKLYKDALQCLLKALKFDRPKMEKYISQRFQACISKSDWEPALTWGSALFRVRGSDPKIANQMGNCARQLEMYSLANNYYRHGLKQDKENQLLRLNLAASLAKCHKYDEEVETALSLFKNLSAPYFPEFTKIGQPLARLIEGDEPGFEALEQEALRLLGSLELPPLEQRLDPELAEKAYNYALFCLKSKEGESALPYLERLLAERHLFNGLELLSCYALIFMQACDRRQTIEILKNTFATSSKNRYLATNIGLLYQEEGNWLQSMRFLLVALSLLEESQGLFGIAEQMQVAEKQLAAGELEKALTFFQVVAEQVDRVDCLQRLGQIYYELEDFTQSAAIWLKLKQAFPEDAAAKEILSQAYRQFVDQAEKFRGRGKTQEAVDLYESAVRFKETATAYKALAALYGLMKNKDKVYDYETKAAHYQQLEEEEELMSKREKLITLGKAMIHQKKYNEALDFLKQAFILKKDKDVFVLQAYLLKNLKRPKALSELMVSWKAGMESTESETNQNDQ